MRRGCMQSHRSTWIYHWLGVPQRLPLSMVKARSGAAAARECGCLICNVMCRQSKWKAPRLTHRSQGVRRPSLCGCLRTCIDGDAAVPWHLERDVGSASLTSSAEQARRPRPTRKLQTHRKQYLPKGYLLYRFRELASSAYALYDSQSVMSGGTVIN